MLLSFCLLPRTVRSYMQQYTAAYSNSSQYCAMRTWEGEPKSLPHSAVLYMATFTMIFNQDKLFAS